MADLYNLSAHYWGGGGISIHDLTITGDVFATIPLNFLHGNSINSWEYILDLANMLVDPVTSCPGVIETSDGTLVDYATAPSAGDYVYRQPGASTPIIYAAGPFYRNRLQTATTASIGSSDHSSLTPSSHSTAFRTALLHRDYDCVITGDDEVDCESAHIVPKNRDDVRCSK